MLCEGITEETLLPVFAKICGCNFKEQGVYIISAGGKNQVVKYFYNFANSLKIPVFILLDNDAEENLREIEPKLRSFDKIHLLKSGEFEDLLPNSLITKTLNYATKTFHLLRLKILNRVLPKWNF
ncbi:MAG: ATP-dependent endonuclease [Candidatus Gastranaerophilaceae bacterium]